MKPSEFGGSDSTPSGLQPKGTDALTSSEKLRMIYRTGQEFDTEAELDEAAFRGQIEGVEG